MANANIVIHPALALRLRAQHGRLRAGQTAILAVAAPLLAAALSWGLVDACLYTQHSLMGLYATSTSLSA